MRTQLKKNQGDSKKDYYSRLESLFKLDPNEDRGFKDISQFAINKSILGDSTYEIINSRIRIKDIVKNPSLKKELSQLVDEFHHKAVLQSYGIPPDNKIIFHGHSGCGKTMTALALGNELKRKVYLVNLSTIVNSSLGKTSNNIFQVVEDAKINQSIVFFDEFDALAKMRNDDNDHGEIKRITSALLQIMDFLDEHTLFIAATNHLELIDKAILRRFSTKIHFDLPSVKHLETYIGKLVSHLKFNISNKVLFEIAKLYKGLSFAETRDMFLKKVKKYIIIETKAKKKVKTIKKSILSI